MHGVVVDIATALLNALMRRKVNMLKSFFMNMVIAQNKNGLSVQKAVQGGMGKSHRAFYQGLLSEGINTQNPQTVTLIESRISCSASL